MTISPSEAASAQPPQLARLMTLRAATIVVIANMVGTGIFTTTGLLLTRLESGWLVLACWLAGGAIAIAGALCYAELATMMPRAGGEYAYLREIYGPLPAFLTGWVSFVIGFAAPIALAAVGCGEYLAASGLLSGDEWTKKGVAVVIVLAFTAVHFAGVRFGTRVQSMLTGLNLLLLGALLLAGFLSPRSSMAFLQSAEFLSAGKPAQLGVTLLWVMFAYSGWNAASYLAEEVREPSRTLPRSLFIGTAVVTLLYLCINVFLFAAAPQAELSGKVAVAETAVRTLFGADASKWFSALVSLALISAISAFLIIGPRVVYAMARDGMFFGFAARVHPRFGTPAWSIVAQGVLSVVMILSGTFGQLLTYVGFALGIFPWMTIAGLIILRRRQPERERPYHVWGYPLTPLFYLLTMGTILIISVVNDPKPPLVAIATIAAGGVVYFLTVWRK